MSLWHHYLFKSYIVKDQNLQQEVELPIYNNIIKYLNLQ